MGYNNPNAARNNTAASGADNGNYKRANGFINIYLAQEDGSRPKIAAIPTYAGKDINGQIHEFLTVKGANEAETAALRAQAVQAILDMLTITFVEVPDEPKKLVLPKLN